MCSCWPTWFKNCAALLPAVLIMTGCASSSPSGQTPPHQPAASADVLKAGDTIKIAIIRPNEEKKPPVEQTIKDDGTISLDLIGSVQAAGRRKGELEKAIYDLYVPKYYKPGRITVIITPDNRFFYVDGYVKNPSRQLYVGEMTVTKAIASAGGATEYGNLKRVTLTRSTGEVFQINCKKAQDNPKLDLPVYPGDQVYVPMKGPFD